MRAFKRLLLLLCTFAPSCLRLAVWRLLGFSVGRGSKVAMFSIVVADHIEFGAGAVIDTLTLVYAPSVFSMGERARVASFVRIIGFGKLLLGPQTFVCLGCLIDTSGDVTVGARTQLGPRGMVYSHGANGLIFNIHIPQRNGPVRIGCDCTFTMGCIIHPRVTVGDRVMVFPGLVVRGDVPSDTALFPPEPEHRAVPLRLLTRTVTDQVVQEKISELLQRCQAHYGGSRLDDSCAGACVLHLTRGRSVCWLRDQDASPPEGLSASRSVIWTLRQRPAPAGVPQFCFEQLTVFGPWTRFAEEIAAFLGEWAGTYFVFDSLAEKPAGPAAT